jgi:hypothetical protein
MKNPELQAARPRIAMPHVAGLFLVAAVLIAAAAAGCGPGRESSKPLLYRVTGKVLDAATKQPLAHVRVRLQAVFQVDFDASRLPAYGGKKPSGSGTMPLTAYGFTKADGSYDVELSQGPEYVRNASAISVDATQANYLPAGCDLPPPKKPQPVYEAPTIFLTPRSLPGVPRSTSPDKPIPWK